MIKQALDEYAASTIRVFKHDRSKTIGASEIGSCARRNWYVKNSQKPDDDYVPQWGASMRGNIYENNLWVPALRRKYGKKFMFGGKAQHTLVDKYLSATPDGLIVGQKPDALRHLGIKDIGSDCFMAEAKSIDPRASIVEARRNNVLQANAQLGLIREKTKYKPNFNVLSYANASFLDEITEFVIQFDASAFKHAKERAKEILHAKHATDMPPEGWIAGGNECRHCPFVKACGIERRNLPFNEVEPPVDAKTRAHFVKMADAVRAIKARREQAEIELRIAEQKMKDELRELGLRKIQGVVSWTNVKGRVSYDNEAIRTEAQLAGIDVEKFVTVGEPTDRLTLADVATPNNLDVEKLVKTGVQPVTTRARKSGRELQ